MIDTNNLVNLFFYSVFFLSSHSVIKLETPGATDTPTANYLNWADCWSTLDGRYRNLQSWNHVATRVTDPPADTEAGRGAMIYRSPADSFTRYLATSAGCHFLYTPLPQPLSLHM